MAVATSCAGANAVVLNLAANTGSVTVTLIGGFTAKLEFEQSADNEATWVGIEGLPQPTGAGVIAATAAGTWRFGVGASTQLCVRASLFTNGPIQVVLNQSPASACRGCDCQVRQ